MAVLSTLPPHEESNYDVVKEKLLVKFRCDRNGFKSKFYTSKPMHEEPFDSFLYRIKRYFDRWVELSAVKTFDELSYLIVSETILSSCDEEFVAYVKDHAPTTIEEMSKTATSYADGRPGKNYVNKSLMKVAFSGSTNEFSFEGSRSRHRVTTGHNEAGKQYRAKSYSPTRERIK